jgi:hypothetical protein
VHAASQLAQGALKAGAASLVAGRLGKIEIRGTEIILGEPTRFTKANIDRFDF